jgi:hypothetical protein
MSRYIVEILTEHGDWVRKSYHKGEDKALIMLQVQEEAGSRCRIIHEGKIIHESE